MVPEFPTGDYKLGVMATKLPSSLKRRASEEPTLLDLDVTSAKRSRLGPTEFSNKVLALCRSV